MAMQNVFNILVDLKIAKTVDQPLVTQNDSVVFILEVMENGIPFDLTDTTIVSLAHTRKDQTVVVTPGTKLGNKATFELGTNETSVTGTVTAKAQFYDTDGRVSTLSFSYQVGLDPTGTDYVPSETEQTLIQVVMADAQAKIDELSAVDVVVLNQQLADKLNVGEVSVSDIDKNRGKFDQTYMTDEFLSQMAGNTPINATPARASVGLEKLSWLDTTVLNHHNPNTDTQDVFLDTANGNTVPDANWKVSDFIPVQAGRTYTSDSTLYACYYDANKVYVSAIPVDVSTTYTVPVGVSYVRHTYWKASYGVLSDGATIIKANATYLEVTSVLNSSEFERIISEAASENLIIKDDSVSIDSLDFATITRLNLHNAATDTQNAYIDGIGGMNLNEGVWKASEFIAVREGKTYTNSSTTTACYYDKNKVFVSEIPLATSTTFTVPIGVAYTRHTYYEAEYGVLCEGTAILDANAVYGDSNVTSTAEFNKLVANSEVANTQGKTILFFGDSITETHTVSEDGLTHTLVKTNFPTYTSEILGTNFVNYGCSGASYKDRTGLTFYQWISNQITVATSTNVNPDIVVIAAGTNDDTYNMGSYETAMAKTTLESLDRLNSFYEAIRWAMWKLRLTYPNAMLYVGIPLQRADFTPTYMITNTNAIKEMAARYNFIVVDGMNESGIVRDFEVNGGEGRYLIDGLHPKENGKEKVGKLYARVIRNTYVD